MITHSRMSHTALPAHIDDDRLVGSGPVIPAPMTEYNVRLLRHLASGNRFLTSSPQTMSYFLNRIEWTLPLRRLVEQMNELGTLRYSLIEEYGLSKLQQIREKLLKVIFHLAERMTNSWRGLMTNRRTSISKIRGTTPVLPMQ
jgi:hypothetical protein